MHDSVGEGGSGARATWPAHAGVPERAHLIRGRGRERAIAATAFRATEEPLRRVWGLRRRLWRQIWRTFRPRCNAQVPPRTLCADRGLHRSPRRYVPVDPVSPPQPHLRCIWFTGKLILYMVYRYTTAGTRTGGNVASGHVPSRGLVGPEPPFALPESSRTNAPARSSLCPDSARSPRTRPAPVHFTSSQNP